MLASAAFAAGQIAGIVLLVTIAGFAVRDQLRKREQATKNTKPKDRSHRRAPFISII